MRRAIARNDSPLAAHREISSRSANDSRNGERERGAKGLRRDREMWPHTVRWCRPICLPISRDGNPSADSSAILSFSCSVNLCTTASFEPIELPIDEGCCVDRLRPRALCAAIAVSVRSPTTGVGRGKNVPSWRGMGSTKRRRDSIPRSRMSSERGATPGTGRLQWTAKG